MVSYDLQLLTCLRINWKLSSTYKYLLQVLFTVMGVSYFCTLVPAFHWGGLKDEKQTFLFSHFELEGVVLQCQVIHLNNFWNCRCHLPNYPMCQMRNFTSLSFVAALFSLLYLNFAELFHNVYIAKCITSIFLNFLHVFTILCLVYIIIPKDENQKMVFINYIMRILIFKEFSKTNMKWRW